LNLGESYGGWKLFDVSNEAYSFGSVADQKYTLVERENRIVKQKQFSATVTGN